MKKILIAVIIVLQACVAFSQVDGPRIYLPIPKNTNLFSGHFINAQVNASWNNFHFINADIHATSNLYLLAYTRSQPILKRTFFSTLIFPVGTLTADVEVTGGGTKRIFKHGTGDLTWLNTINIVGGPGLMIKDWLRHDVKTVLYFQSGFTFPTGNYSSSDSINIGSNQFKFKLGMPFIQALGPWVNGKRLILELYPSVTFQTKNDNFLSQRIEQKPTFILESHLSRDLTRKAYLSFDYTFIYGGKMEFKDRKAEILLGEQDAQITHLLGGTVNLSISDHITLMVTHLQTIKGSNANIALEGALTKATIVFSWHDFLEKAKNYSEGM